MRRPTRSDPDRHIQHRRPWHRLALGSGVQGRWVQGVASTVAASLLVSGCLITNAATDTLATGGTIKPGTLPAQFQTWVLQAGSQCGLTWPR